VNCKILFAKAYIDYPVPGSGLITATLRLRVGDLFPNSRFRVQELYSLAAKRFFSKDSVSRLIHFRRRRGNLVAVNLRLPADVKSVFVTQLPYRQDLIGFTCIIRPLSKKHISNMATGQSSLCSSSTNYTIIVGDLQRPVKKKTLVSAFCPAKDKVRLRRSNKARTNPETALFA